MIYIGKTTIVQYLSRVLSKNLTVINLSQQTDSSDLLGGFKPVDATLLASPLVDRFENLFGRTFSASKNAAFLNRVRIAFAQKRWDIVLTGFKNALRMAEESFGLVDSAEPKSVTSNSSDNQSSRKSKRQKKWVDDPLIRSEWKDFANSVNGFAAQVEYIKNSFLFSFVEGSLVKAVKSGDWILLDEINLATSDTLESLASLLQGPRGSLTLLERGDSEPVQRHPEFRLFACMNPANDAGKRDLPPGLLSRFTEIWVDSPDVIRSDLNLIIKQHLNAFLPPPSQGGDAVVDDVASFYNCAKKASADGRLVDCAGQRAHISLRTLTRGLKYAADFAPVYGLRRGLYDGCQMTFATMLAQESIGVMSSLINQYILNGIKNISSFIKAKPRAPSSIANENIDEGMDVDECDSTFLNFDCFWIKKGPLPPNAMPHYVLTKSVEANLFNLVCITLIHL